MTEQHDYFKWVALKEDDPDWYERELLAGRARFGWSPPGADLRAIKDKMDRFSWSERTAQEAEAWSYGSYLIQYTHPGSRLVIQTRRPLRSFWLAEVIDPGYQFDGEHDDFNHIFHVKLASQKPIPIDLKEISPSLRHDISKRTVRGKYQIYPEESVAGLSRLWAKLENGWSNKRTEAHTFEEMRDELTQVVYKNISQRWKSKDFEVFCEKLCEATDNIEVVSRSDTGGGWDLLIKVIDPLTGNILHEDVPVQCKNYSGVVSDFKAIEDLGRCIENTKKDIAYLFILGELSQDFHLELKRKQEQLCQKLGTNRIKLEIVDQTQIAHLYQKSQSQLAFETGDET